MAKAVRKPAGESGSPLRKGPTQASIVEGSDRSVALTKASRRRLVYGKRDHSLVPTGAVNPASIIGLDERTRIVDTDDAPWRMVASLSIEAPWGNFVGTGWFAGPRTIITAGHCVYDRNQMGGWADRITVLPGLDGSEQPFGAMEVDGPNFSTVDLWLDKQDPDFDVGVIHLPKSFNNPIGTFGLGSFPDNDLMESMVNVAGYPGDKGGDQQWWARNRIRAVTARRIYYDVDTMGGQSGAPVFLLENESSRPVVIGIHAYGTGGTPTNIPLEVNSAPRLIPEVIEQIKSWIQVDNEHVGAGVGGQGAG